MNQVAAVQTTTPVPNGQANGGGTQGAAVPLQPFVRAALEHQEPLSIDTSVVLGNQTNLGTFDVNAYGFLRSIVLYVTATGGTGTAAVYTEDAPWSIFSEVVLQDVNGAPIVGPISGYDLFLIHKWGGGLAGNPDPTRVPSYVAPTTAGNFAFSVRVPVEISSRDGLGCLPNQNAAQTYKLRLTQAATADVMSTPATGMPTIRVRAWGEYWSQPTQLDVAGQPNQMDPPAVGTTGYWTKSVYPINSGYQTVRMTRVGSFIRNMILVLRTTAPARSSTNMPDPIMLFKDGVQLLNQGRQLQPMYMAERSLTSTIETGVTLFDHTHDWDGLYGGEMRDQWLWTTQATRLEWQGTFGAAGTLTVLTNDVAVKGNPFIG